MIYIVVRVEEGAGRADIDPVAPEAERCDEHHRFVSGDQYGGI
jgi:hypothetical protein